MIHKLSSNPQKPNPSEYSKRVSASRRTAFVITAIAVTQFRQSSQIPLRHASVGGISRGIGGIRPSKLHKNGWRKNWGLRLHRQSSSAVKLGNLLKVFSDKRENNYWRGCSSDGGQASVSNSGVGFGCAETRFQSPEESVNRVSVWIFSSLH